MTLVFELTNYIVKSQKVFLQNFFYELNPLLGLILRLTWSFFLQQVKEEALVGVRYPFR